MLTTGVISIIYVYYVIEEGLKTIFTNKLAVSNAIAMYLCNSEGKKKRARSENEAGGFRQFTFHRNSRASVILSPDCVV